MTEKKHVVVIGAGVTGLQTSISLLEAGYRVTILAKHFPGDSSVEYTSPWAGGQWRSHAPPDDREQQAWDTETYNYWLSILARELNEPKKTVKSGLGLYESLFYSSSPQRPWFASTVLSYQEILSSSLPPEYRHGHKYTSIMINVPVYLNYLFDTAISLGAIPVKATLPRSSSLAGVLRAATEILEDRFRTKGQHAPKIDAFVNATGISARELVPDLNVFPIRGQTVLVRGEVKRITTIDAQSDADNNPVITYILPRPGSNTTVLGGTKQANNWTAEPDPDTTKRILEQAKKWAPELLNADGEFDILAVNVGLRPGRKGGARVEIEDVVESLGVDGRRFLVCHAYGHAGAGYQNSVGSAKKVVRLLNEKFGVEVKESIPAKL